MPFLASHFGLMGERNSLQMKLRTEASTDNWKIMSFPCDVSASLLVQIFVMIYGAGEASSMLHHVKLNRTRLIDILACRNFTGNLRKVQAHIASEIVLHLLQIAQSCIV